MSGRKALVVGIDGYRHMRPLTRCVGDAENMAKLLGKHHDESPNFATRELVSSSGEVSSAAMHRALMDLFSGQADVALLYFSGHGLFDADMNVGRLVAQDGREGAWGPSMAEILNLANRAYPRIGSTLIILDCCHAGAAGLDAAGSTVIGPGVTILAASRHDQAAFEGAAHSVFTELLIEGLEGGAADILGRVTPASLYALADEGLGLWDQRPLYKANVQNLLSLRTLPPRVPLQTLRRLPKYFPRPWDIYALDPSCERDRTNITNLAHIPLAPERVAIFEELQRCNRHGLVEPVGEDEEGNPIEHMYYAAIKSKGCRLTALGRHYRNRAQMGRL